ncbi:winged helix-turn-helix transcriptional regulator [bacterium]|nr:winged helix-turn-helix transcriptional regulator [bacterium]
MYEKAVEIFKLIGNESRFKILLALIDNNGCVTEVAKNTGISQSLVSQIIKKFIYMDLIEKRTEGHKRFYCIKDKKLVDIIAELINYVKEK